MKPLQVASSLGVICCVVGCTTAQRSAPAPPNGTYEEVPQLMAMPARALTIESVSPCSARLRGRDGSAVYIGSPGAAPEVVGFVQTLERGRSYVFPDAFLNYAERANITAGGVR